MKCLENIHFALLLAVYCWKIAPLRSAVVETVLNEELYRRSRQSFYHRDYSTVEKEKKEKSFLENK